MVKRQERMLDHQEKADWIDLERHYWSDVGRGQDAWLNSARRRFVLYIDDGVPNRHRGVNPSQFFRMVENIPSGERYWLYIDLRELAKNGGEMSQLACQCNLAPNMTKLVLLQLLDEIWEFYNHDPIRNP